MLKPRYSTASSSYCYRWWRWGPSSLLSRSSTTICTTSRRARASATAASGNWLPLGTLSLWVDGDVIDGAQAHVLGLAAACVLPAAVVTTFFLGMALIIVAHIRAGSGEGGHV